MLPSTQNSEHLRVFLLVKIKNIKKYCNDVALSQCRDSNLSLCLDVSVYCMYLCVLVSVGEWWEREWCVCVCVCFNVCVCFSVCVCVFVCLVCTKVVTRILHMIFHFSAFRRFLCRDPEAAFLFFRWFIFNRGYRKQKQRSTNSNFVDIFEVVSRCRHNIFLVM